MRRLLVVAGLVALLPTSVVAQSITPAQTGVSDQPARAKASAPAKAKKKANSATARSATASTTRFRAASVKPVRSVGLFSGWWDDDDDDDRPVRRAPTVPTGPIVTSGGPRPEIERQSPSQVSYASGQPAGTIVIDSAKRRLFLVQGPSTALSYPVSVGREGFSWTGSEKISRVADWPDWHPPAEMRVRDPRLPTKMTGGIRNPLGAKALYLGTTLYRIHGTSDARSIGRAASSGCFRMHNSHVVDLASRVGVGTRVVVINASRTRTAASDEDGRSRSRSRPAE